MTAPSPLFDFDDSSALIAADIDGILRMSALGGAQIRATASAVDEQALDRLHDLHPRSVVLVGGDARSARAAELVVAMLAAHATVPLVVAPTTPTWVGPLDVVVVAGDDAGDPTLVESVAAGLQRRAEVVVGAPDEGPIRAAVAGRALLLPPRIHLPSAYALARHVAVFCAVLTAMAATKVRSHVPDLAELADAVDNEAARNHPSNEVFHNPAKSLAVRMYSRRVALAGDSPATTSLARHGAEMLLLGAGMIAAAASLPDTLAARDRLVATTTGTGEPYDPFFHDEQLDGPIPEAPVRVFVLSTDDDRRAAQRRAAALPDMELVSVVGETESRAVPPVLEQALVLAARIEMAAAYLRLAGGR
ncbi:tobH protein [Rhodococcus sp. HM1]|uniref:tobH protein n=1 Tax=Rhodococcus sp. HM1 TaxID=2937759 RepID=UPI00200A0C20|nr:tobH protein [Rhodococcus sp. HM1]MCK8670068.1 tobH protein [Rhodococcus sp. HM1]